MKKEKKLKIKKRDKKVKKYTFMQLYAENC